MSNYKSKIRITLIVVIALLFGSGLGVMLERAAFRAANGWQGDKLTWALNQIEERYVDKITRDSLAEIAIPVLLEELDPHSVYIPAQDFEATNEPLTGTFDGIGVVFNMLTDTVQVTSVISGGPSADAGIFAGDQIITVNDSIIAGVKRDQNKVVGVLRGERGTKVKLGILRMPSKELLHITVTRGAIPVKSLEASFIVPGSPEIGYVKFSRFAATTYNEVMKALVELKEKGAKKIILDLRGNGGGYLEPAIYIANEFLPKGEKIVYTQGHSSPRVDQNATGLGMFQDIEIAVVIDETSASASEIVAGAIQDNDRGVIVGRRSFGKGLVQEQMSYKPDGSAMRLTVARYYTPVGRSIQKPYTPGDKEAYDDFNRKIIWGLGQDDDKLAADSINLPDSLQFMTPKGKIVYGGGGIMPDVFVPRDTTGLTPYYLKLHQKNLIFLYANHITNRYRKEINSIKTLVELKIFFAGKNLFYDFVAYASRKGVRPTQTEMTLSKALITARIKGFIGRNTPLEESAFYYQIFPEDNTLIKTVEILTAAPSK